jgi:hypothetical protein
MSTPKESPGLFQNLPIGEGLTDARIPQSFSVLIPFIPNFISPLAILLNQSDRPANSPVHQSIRSASSGTIAVIKQP